MKLKDLNDFSFFEIDGEKYMLLPYPESMTVGDISNSHYRQVLDLYNNEVSGMEEDTAVELFIYKSSRCNNLIKDDSEEQYVD